MMTHDTIELAEPLLCADGRALTTLTMRPPRVKDLKAAQRVSEVPAEQELALLGRLVGVVPEDLEELLLADYARLQERFRLAVAPGGGPVGGGGVVGAVVPVPAIGDRPADAR